MAIGFIYHGKNVRPAALVSSDGGKKWEPVQLPQLGSSLFCLNEKLCWMAGKDAVWETRDFARTWRKLKTLPGVEDVYFTDRQHGWAACGQKSVFATVDGGVSWSPVPAATSVPANPRYTTFRWIRFANSRDGMIGGWSSPPRRNQEKPAWLDPQAARYQREWPSLFITLETRDSGKTWIPATTSLIGQVARVSLSPDGRGLAVIQFLHDLAYPSEVHRLDLKTGATDLVFREANRLITDVLVVPDGPGYLAGLESVGKLGAQSPVPGKVKILQSGDLTTWTEMEVDYRAVANRVVLAMAGNELWAATDTGMILKWSSGQVAK
jgi:hypothetical protein